LTIKINDMQFQPGSGRTQWFRDLPGSPEMVVVPAGEFLMGSSHDDSEGLKQEMPVHRVTLLQPFAIGRFAVTLGQFSAFVDATGREMPNEMYTGEDGGNWVQLRDHRSFRQPGFPQEENHPVVGVSWNDAQAYATWLTELTGKSYRLPSEAEWEYAARAGTTTRYWWGDAAPTQRANFNTPDPKVWPPDRRHSTVPVDTFEPNPWGLYNVHGNTWEWCEDSWHESYDSAPLDGSAWVDRDGLLRVLRGGSWYGLAGHLRGAQRSRDIFVWYYSDNGFRLARSLSDAA
jgi:formylglycine-generating enzyme required for sulfatase activity